MTKKTKYYPILALLFLVSSCIEPYKPVLERGEEEYILVVEGLITNQPGSFEVKLSRSVPVDTTINSLPERGAHVMVTADSGNIYDFYEADPRIYKSTDNNAKAAHGREYQLIITDFEGNTYESSLVKMEPTPDIKRIYWKETSKNVFADNEVFQEKGINIYIESEEPASETYYYKWDFTETWKTEMPNYVKVISGIEGIKEVFVKIPQEKKHCWVTRPSAAVLVKSLRQQEQTKIDSFLVKHIPENLDLLYIRYSIEVKQYCLDKEMYDFWNNLKKFNEEIGTMFDQVPYSIYGNITCCENEEKKVLGYFDAAEVKTKRIFIDKSEHRVPVVNYYDRCVYVGIPNPYPFVGGLYATVPFCTDCRETGSSTKPDFWDSNSEEE
ncbi:MAG: DUF4249 domain-containing protein [Prolixibacteraceae bacterium]